MFTRTMTRIGAGVGLAAAFTLGSGMAAYAHECYNPNRSQQGDAGANHSQAWMTVYFEELTMHLEPADAECVMDAYERTGSPTSFTIHVKGANGQDGVIAGNNPHEGKAVDGQGIDEIFAAYGGDIVGSFEYCGASLPF